MSNEKFREQISEEVRCKDAVRSHALERYNQVITNELSDFYKENEADVNNITEKLTDVANCQLEYGAIKGFERGYNIGYESGVTKGMGTATAIITSATVAGWAFIYRDEIKEYGKYVIGKFKKRRG